MTERAEQMAEAVQIVRGLLGERDATKVAVSVSRGGTLHISAEVADGDKVRRHEFSAGGRK